VKQLAQGDEAHGREGCNFALALDDQNLAIRKRLFLTVTRAITSRPASSGGAIEAMNIAA